MSVPGLPSRRDSVPPAEVRRRYLVLILMEDEGYFTMAERNRAMRTTEEIIDRMIQSVKRK